MNAIPGQRLGPYEIIERLGAGGMGEVWKARDHRLDRTVAIKIANAEYGERCEREARAIAALNHPNIATLFDVGPNYLVMEYVEGEALRGPLTIDRVMQYAAQICDALDAAHRRGITHRDLKPGNILVNKQGIKLLDFGLAKIREALAGSEETISNALTTQGIVLGTPQYMAPEQVEGKDVDARTDIFALGCVLYELVTGRKAFEGETASTVAAAILSTTPPPIPNVSPALHRIISRCLAKDPDDRYQNARDVKWALAESGDSRPAETRSALAPWALVVLLGATLAFVYFRQSPPVEERVLQFEVRPPEKARVDQVSISPDGNLLLTVVEEGGDQSLWIRPLNSMTARPLAGTEGGHAAFWSPDSRFVAFIADDKLRRIEVAGGMPQTICEQPGSRGIGTWNEAGDILFTVDQPAMGNGNIEKVSASGGSPVDVLKFDEASGEMYVYSPRFLPDGRHFLFTGGGSTGSTVYAASLDGKGGRQVLLQGADSAEFMPAADPKRSGVPGYLFYYLESRLMAQPFDPEKLEFLGDAIQITERARNYSVSRSGVLVWQRGSQSADQVTWISDQRKTLATAGNPAKVRRDLSLSPDNRRAAVSLWQSGRWDIWTIDLERGVHTRLTSGGTDKSDPLWSRRGSRIFFTEEGPGVQGDIYSIGPDGEKVEPVVKTPNYKVALDTSPDDSFLLYSENDPQGKQRIWALPLKGDRHPFRMVGSEFNEREAKFSPNGRWVAYTSDESGDTQVYLKPFPPTERRWQISSDFGRSPRWRGDGRQLYYHAGSHLMVVDLKLGNTVEASRPRPLFVPPTMWALDPTPDGTRFLTTMEDEASFRAPLNVIVNWPATLLSRGR